LVQELADLLSDLGDRIQSLRSQLDTQQMMLNNEAANRHDQGEQLRLLLSNASAEIAQVAHEAVSSLASFDAVGSRIEATVSEAIQSTASLPSTADQMLAHLQHSSQRVQVTVETLLHHEQERLEAAVVKAAEELRETLVEHMVTLMHSAAEDLVGSINRHANEVLQPLVDDLAHAVERMIDTVIKEITVGEGEARHENAELRPVIDLLKPLVAVLMAEVKRVEDLRQMVGA
jgi:F0F1-type ATP synthase membrane subunit b/b'